MKIKTGLICFIIYAIICAVFEKSAIDVFAISINCLFYGWFMWFFIGFLLDSLKINYDSQSLLILCKMIMVFSLICYLSNDNSPKNHNDYTLIKSKDNADYYLSNGTDKHKKWNINNQIVDLIGNITKEETKDKKITFLNIYINPMDCNKNYGQMYIYDVNEKYLGTAVNGWSKLGNDQIDLMGKALCERYN